MAAVGRVLIADDDDAIRNLVSKVLELAQVPHDAVSDGQAAIEQLQQHDYDVLLIDLMMPRVDGFELLDYVREHPPHGIVVVMTAADDADLRRLDSSVVTTIVRKPFDIHELAILVRDAALRAAAAREASEEDGGNVVPFSR